MTTMPECGLGQAWIPVPPATRRSSSLESAEFDLPGRFKGSPRPVRSKARGFVRAERSWKKARASCLRLACFPECDRRFSKSRITRSTNSHAQTPFRRSTIRRNMLRTPQHSVASRWRNLIRPFSVNRNVCFGPCILFFSWCMGLSAVYNGPGMKRANMKP